MTATRPTSTLRGALSPRLAALRLAELRTAALARIVAEETLAAVGGERAVVWV